MYIHKYMLFGEYMTGQTITPDLAVQNLCVENMLEEARDAHEKYLIRQQECDLERAVECYIDVIKSNPTLSEAYYR